MTRATAIEAAASLDDRSTAFRLRLPSPKPMDLYVDSRCYSMCSGEHRAHFACRNHRRLTRRLWPCPRPSIAIGTLRRLLEEATVADPAVNRRDDGAIGGPPSIDERITVVDDGWSCRRSLPIGSALARRG